MSDNPIIHNRNHRRRSTQLDCNGVTSRRVRVALLFMLLIPCEAIASALWPNDFLDFFSLDMRPVEVIMFYGLVPEGAPGIRFTVPRAWITGAPGYNPRELDKLPDQIFIPGGMDVWLSDPDGEAFSIRATEYAHVQGINLTEAIHRLRSDEYNISLSKTGTPRSKEVWRQGQSKDRFKGRESIEKDGLPYDPPTGTYFLHADDTELAFIYCAGRRPHPVWFCDYTVWINPDIIATFYFVDFRTHGGPDFAIARIKRGLDVMCRQSNALCRKPDPAGSGQRPKE